MVVSNAPEHHPVLAVPASCDGHHWLIEPPDGPTSRGICRFCREEREFRNHGGSMEGPVFRSARQADVKRSKADKRNDADDV